MHTEVVGMPAQLASFVGREREIAAVRRLLGGARLLSLTGAGGSGKTRLALEVLAREAAEGGTPGAWVELAPLRDPSLVPGTVLAALGVRDESDTPAIDRLAGILRERAFVLVLDNCEHLVEACASLADTLLRACPNLRILVTTRAALGVTGEVAWLVPPLSLPAADASADESEAVQLFVQRAQSVQPAFVLTDDNRHTIVDICRRLDGLPLALELAAARLRALRPEQIAARLDDRFRLLTTGNRAALPRHQTLRAAIDWSYDLLDDRERLLLDRLSVFSGTFSLEAAEGVCASDEIPSSDVLDLLSDLVEKSLVEMIDAGDVARYRLLETVREYAGARLDARGERDIHQRHAGFFVAMIATAEPHLSTSQRPRWIGRLDAELDNIRQALAWTRDGNPELHMRAVGMLHWFWFATGQWPEARQWLRSALTVPNAEQRTRDRAAVLFSAGSIASMQARSESARVHLVEAESIAEETGDRRLLAYVRLYLAMACVQIASADTERPLRLAHEAMLQANDLYGLRLSYLIQASAWMVRGDLARAVERAEEGVRVARVFGLDRELAIGLQQLAHMVGGQGDIRRAATLLREALEALQRDPQLFFIARSLEMMATSFVSMDATASTALDAARLYGAAAAIREMIGAKMWQLDRDRHEPQMAAARQRAGDAAFAAAFEDGRRLTPRAAMGLAIDLASRSGCADGPDVTTQTGEFQAVRMAPSAPRAERGLRVNALGPLEVAIDGDAVASKRWGYAKTRELLVLLLLHPGGRTREQIGAALWPEASAAQVRNNFHVALHHLRRALGHAEWVKFEGERYRIAVPDDAPVTFDAAEFEEEATRLLRASRRGDVSLGDLRNVIAKYRGPLLDGETMGDWCLEHHDRLARLHAEALHALGNALLADGACDEAAQIFERLVRQEELDEDASRALMTARSRAGDRPGAIRDYRRLESVLRRELDVGPDSDTAALFRRIQRGEAV